MLSSLTNIPNQHRNWKDLTKRTSQLSQSRFANGGGIGKRSNKDTKAHPSKSRHHRAGFHEHGGREELLEQEMKLKLSEMQLEMNTCGDNSILDFTTDRCKPKSRKKRSLTRAQKNKDKKFRVPLKEERHEFRNEYIEYNADFPHRVGIRLEYLMGSTRVRLNDRQYMERLYYALDKEEALNTLKIEYDREKIELERVKKLVVEGEMPPPKELLHMYQHPVFRVNAMLRRLEIHDDTLTAVPKTDDSFLTLCEPFEYDSSKYFIHLHKTGNRDWLPKSVRRVAGEKRREKIERARKRREEKKAKEKEVDELRLLFRSTESHVVDEALPRGSVTSGWGSMFSVTTLPPLIPVSASSEDEDLKGTNPVQQDRRFDPIEVNLKRNNSDDAHNNKLVVEQLLAESIEQRERELKRKRLYREKEQRQEVRLRARELTRRKVAAKDNYSSSSSMSVWFTDEPVTPPIPGVDESLELLRKSYNITGASCVEQYRPPRDQLIMKYIEDVEDPEEMFKNGKEVKLLFEREQQVCEKFMRKLNLFR